MALTRLGGANAISGTIPQGNIANASLGAVTTLPAADGSSLTNLPLGLTLLSTTTVSSGDSTVSLAVSDDTYDNFYVLATQVEGTSSSNGRGRLRMKRASQSSFDSGSSDYAAEGILIDTGTNVFNNNYNSNAIQIFPFDIACNRPLSFSFYVIGARTTDFRTMIQSGFTQEANGSYSSGTVFSGNRDSTDKVTNVQFDYTTGNLESGKFVVYGIKK